MTAAELEKELKKEFQGLSAKEKRAYEEMNKEDARQVKERVGGKKRKDEMEVEVPSSDEAIADQKESGKEKAKKKKEKKASERKEGKEKEKQEKKQSKSCSVCSSRVW